MTKKWKSFPKFNTPEKKAELNEFAAEIAPECAIHQINFNEEGISKHIQDFFNEQRRYKKKRNLVSQLGFVLQTHCLAKCVVAEDITPPFP